MYELWASANVEIHEGPSDDVETHTIEHRQGTTQYSGLEQFTSRFDTMLNFLC